MDCPNCSRLLTEEDVDNRHEWTRIYYYCNSCDKEFSRLITYKIQSTMVESDMWEDSNEPV